MSVKSIAVGIGIGFLLLCGLATFLLHKENVKLQKALAISEANAVKWGQRVIEAEKAQKLCEQSVEDARQAREAAQHRVIKVMASPVQLPQSVLDRLQTIQGPCTDAVAAGAAVLSKPGGGDHDNS